MNITFLIGNGFDRNLGLATSYSEFVNYYKKLPSATKTISKFKEHIKENEELWSNAEIALGEYTAYLERGEGALFSECQLDFCEKLADYLKKEEERIDYTKSEEAILKAFSNICSTTTVFPSQERNIINQLFGKHIAEVRNFNFICFNYTNTLDNCLSVVSQHPDILGSHKSNNNIYPHQIDKIKHVHGTVDKEMVFAVNDESQIAKTEIFDCENGDLYKDLLIKIQANAGYLEDTDSQTAKILQESNLVYVYGMSFGDTDKLWWERLCNWLKLNSERHLIVQKYGMPEKTVLPLKYQLSERQAKKDITRHLGLVEEEKEIIEKRMHITGSNIFGEISKIANTKIEPIVVDILKDPSIAL